MHCWVLDTIMGLRKYCSQSRSSAVHCSFAKWWKIFQNVNQHSKGTFFVQLLPAAYRKQTRISLHCSRVPGAASAEQWMSKPLNYSLITCIQQNGPSNCPFQYYLLCIQKCLHIVSQATRSFCDLKVAFGKLNRGLMIVSMAGWWAIYVYMYY